MTRLCTHLRARIREWREEYRLWRKMRRVRRQMRGRR